MLQAFVTDMPLICLRLKQYLPPVQEDYAPGELGFDPLGLCPPDGSQEKYDMQTKELNNGRLVRTDTSSKLNSHAVNIRLLAVLMDVTLDCVDSIHCLPLVVSTLQNSLSCILHRCTKLLTNYCADSKNGLPESQAMIAIAGFVAQELKTGHELFSQGITDNVPGVIINKS